MAEPWGGLNPALTAWRNAVNKLLVGRSTRSDGARADANHGSDSQHQEDSDGTVDAFDMDVNVLNSSTSTGSAEELKILEALKKDFEADGRAHLWIHNREIAQHNHGWAENYYGGESPHNEHVHWEARQDREKDGSTWHLPHTEAALGVTMDQVIDALESEAGQKAIGRAVHNQKLGASTETVGLALQSQIEKDVTASVSAEVAKQLATLKEELLAELLPPPAV